MRIKLKRNQNSASNFPVLEAGEPLWFKDQLYIGSVGTASEGDGTEGELMQIANANYLYDGFLFPNALTDIDGNRYGAVIIGNQVWLASNYRCKTFSDGTPIAYGGGNPAEFSDTTPYWSYPGNNSDNFDSRGLLYNNAAVLNGANASSANPSGVQGIAPDNWHIPSLAEWQQLNDYIKKNKRYLADLSTANSTAKALCSRWYWTETTSASNGRGPGYDRKSNNATGLSLRGTGRQEEGGFTSVGAFGSYATCTEYNGTNMHSMYLRYNYGYPYIGDSNYIYPKGCSNALRLVSNLTPQEFLTWYRENFNTIQYHTRQKITANSEAFDYNATIDIQDGRYISVEPDSSANTITVSTNVSDGYVFPNAVQDGDGNWYDAVTIGDQVWLTENLRTKHYSDRTTEVAQGAIGTYSSDSALWCIYGNTNYHQKYGKLYNWKAAMGSDSASSENPSGVQGLAPTGWHIPSKAEFQQLINYVSSQSRYPSRRSLATSLSGIWTTTSSNAVGTNLTLNNGTGFNAKANGCAYSGYATVDTPSYSTTFITSTEADSDSSKYYIYSFSYSSGAAAWGAFSSRDKSTYSGIRCVCDLDPVQFRSWYVNQYGGMQHIVKTNTDIVLANDVSSSTASPSLIFSRGSINLPDGNDYIDWWMKATSSGAFQLTRGLLPYAADTENTSLTVNVITATSSSITTPCSVESTGFKVTDHIDSNKGFVRSDGTVDENTYALASAIPTVNNATLTLDGGGGLTVSADPTFTANASSNKTITITHPSATAYASGFYKITINDTGHVTAASAVTATDITGLVGTHAGGTQVTLNGNGGGANADVSIYAPVGSGTTGQYLKSNGENAAPTWTSFDTAISEVSTNAVQNQAVGTELVKLWDKKNIASRLNPVSDAGSTAPSSAWQSSYNTYYTCYINSYGEWVRNGIWNVANSDITEGTSTYAGKHLILPLTNIKKVGFRRYRSVSSGGTVTTRRSAIAFLKSYTPPTSETLPVSEFATGTSIIFSNTDTVNWYDVPNDAVWLYVWTWYGYDGNHFPNAEFLLTGIGITEYEGTGSGFVKDDGTVDTKAYITADDLPADSDEKVTPVLLAAGDSDFPLLTVPNRTSPTTNGNPNYCNGVTVNGNGVIKPVSVYIRKGGLGPNENQNKSVTIEGEQGITMYTSAVNDEVGQTPRIIFKRPSAYTSFDVWNKNGYLAIRGYTSSDELGLIEISGSGNIKLPSTPPSGGYITVSGTTSGSGGFFKSDGSIDYNSYLTSFTETDPTVPAWAKAADKPSYNLDEVLDGESRKLLTIGTTGTTAAAGNHNHDSTYVKFDPGTTEQVIKTSIGTFSRGVITLYRTTGDHYTFMGFSNKGSDNNEKYLGGIGFKSTTDLDLYIRHTTDNAIENAAVYTQVWSGANLIGENIFDETDIVGLLRKRYDDRRYYISSNGSWSNSSYYHWAIPLDGVRKVKVKANSSKAAIIAFLASYTPNVGTTTAPSSTFSSETGFGSRLSVAIGDTEEYTVPSDAKFLYVYGGTNSSVDATPESVKLTGWGITEHRGSGNKYIKDNGTLGNISEFATSSHVHGNITNDGKVGTESGKPLITTTGGAVTTGSFGTGSGTFCEGNDSRLSDSRTPLSHTHGNISNDGKVGSAANLPLITGTGGAVTTGSFGNTANTFCEGNDARLSDARTPNNDSNLVHKDNAETITGLKTFTNGLILNTGTSWTNTDRAIPFSKSGDPETIQYVYDNANKGLTFNPNTGELKAAKFVKRSPDSSPAVGILLTDGSDIPQNTFLTSFTETDPTVPAWAKASTKPSYTLDEVSDGTSRKLLVLGDTSTTAAAGNHTHAGVYQPVGNYLTAESNGFGKVYVAAQSTGTSNLSGTTSAKTLNSDSAADTLNISTGNKWIQIKADGDAVASTADNDKLTFGHSVPGVTTGGSVRKFDYDEAGHITAVSTPTASDLTGIIGNAYSTTDTNYYPTTVTWTGGDSAGPTGTITIAGGGDNVSIPAIPAASSSASGIITTGEQTIAGVKKFTSDVWLYNSGTGATPYLVFQRGSASASYDWRMYNNSSGDFLIDRHNNSSWGNILTIDVSDSNAVFSPAILTSGVKAAKFVKNNSSAAEVLLGDGSSVTAASTAGKVLTSAASGAPTWADLPAASTAAAGIVQLGTTSGTAAEGNHTHNYIPTAAAAGSTTKPIYLSAQNTFAECSQFAGGTAVTLNGDSKAADTASFYAPTTAGDAGKYLKSNGSGAPSWADLPADSDTKVTQTKTADTNSSWRPFIIGKQYAGSTPSTSTALNFNNPASDPTDTVYATHLGGFKPSTGEIIVGGIKRIDSSTGKLIAGSTKDVWNTNGNTTTLADVATTGSYNDLDDTPTITDEKVTPEPDATSTAYPMLLANNSSTPTTNAKPKYSASLSATGTGDIVFTKSSTTGTIQYDGTDKCFKFIFS